MQMQKEIPEMYVYDQSRKVNYGAIKECTSLTKDIRFGSCSEINLEVPKQYYDTETCSWIDNPVYDSLIKHNLVYVADDTKYFSFPSRPLANYSIDASKMTYRVNAKSLMSFSQNQGLNNFTLQTEKELFRISPAAGYHWQNLSQINSGAYHKYTNWSTHFPYIACTDYIPIQPHDIIALRSRVSMGYCVTLEDNYNVDNIKFAAYYIHFYSTNDPASYCGTFHVDPNLANPVYRFSVNALSGESTYSNITRGMANGGYIRVSAVANFYRDLPSGERNGDDDSYTAYYLRGNPNILGWAFPYDGWLNIYSGERRCTKILNGSSTGSFEPYLHWFVISDVEEDFDGVTATKKIKLYSYEYSLSWRTVSISGGTIPLFIPEDITNAVNSNTWIIDRTERMPKQAQSMYSAYTSLTYGAQCMRRGLLNMILDELPQWSIGHISSKLMTRYREFDDVDNAGIYTFLMNDVANAYQCYFVFDGDSMTISAYSQDDIIQNSNVVLNWDNAIKHLNITSSSSERITALRVHTADDTYGLGLVNPYGGSVLYNFNNVLDKMDFVADDSEGDPLRRNEILDNQGNRIRFRTLKEAVEEMQSYAKSPCTETFCNSSGYISPIPSGGIRINSLSDYRDYAKKFVNANLGLIEAQTKHSELTTQYHTIADKINMYLKLEYPDEYDEHHIPEIPNGTRPQNLSSGNYSYYHSRELYIELANATNDFWDSHVDINEYLGNISTGGSSKRLSVARQLRIYKKLLSNASQKLNLNYKRQMKLIEEYPNGITRDSAQEPTDEFSILTPKEILALQPFIIEGDWTNENVVFSETYGADDIVDTLVDVMNQANNDFENIYSKDNYDFETDMINWAAIEEMQEQAKQLKVGQTVCLNTEPNKWIRPILLELHINYKDENDFKMTLTTDYNRKPLQFRFADLYGTITQTSVTDSAFTFDE